MILQTDDKNKKKNIFKWQILVITLFSSLSMHLIQC